MVSNYIWGVGVTYAVLIAIGDTSIIIVSSAYVLNQIIWSYLGFILNSDCFLKLNEHYYGVLRISDGGGGSLLWEQLNANNPTNFTVTKLKWLPMIYSYIFHSTQNIPGDLVFIQPGMQDMCTVPLFMLVMCQ